MSDNRLTFHVSRFTPLLAALAVLLAAWLLPLPGIVSGSEQLVALRMPQTRATTEDARRLFEQAQADYQAYVKTHDLTAVLANVQSAIEGARKQSDDPSRLNALRDATLPVAEYVEMLRGYAEVGERYFEAIKRYDDDLMAWSRSLGAASEQLRSETWPFVEYIKEYPPPIGETPDPPYVTAAQVGNHAVALKAHIESLDPGLGADAASRQETISAIEQAVANVWADGRSIERIESLHSEYYRLLRQYDRKVEAVAAGGSTVGTRPDRVLLATALNIVVGALTLGGLVAIFMRRPPGG